MIKFDSICLNYNGKIIFDNFSLDILRKQKVVFLGPSGAGKSSLFRLLLGFIRPDSGSVCFDSVCLDERTIWGARRGISYVDQDVSAPSGKTSEWLSFAFKLKANSFFSLEEEKVKEAMGYFGLRDDLLDKDILQLSGGERQRMALVISVLLGREVFLLDEVTSALDRRLKEKVADFFISKKNWTVVAITHDNAWIDNPAVKVFDLEAGAWTR